MRRERDVFLPPIVVDRTSPRSLHAQVRDQISRAIESDSPAGARLPSTRALATFLGISRNTVLAAYDDLVASGVLRARRGAGMHVAGASTAPMPAVDPRRVLREAQYPMRTVSFVDFDGTPLYFTY